MQDYWAKRLWRNTNVGYYFSNSSGLKGGLITLWKEGLMEVLLRFKGEGFWGIKITWKDHLYYIVNVYSSCILRKKKELWARFLELKEKYMNR